MEIKNVSDEKLIEITQELFQSIFISDCFGTKDLIFYELAVRELGRRGYEVKEQKNLIIEK